VLFDGAPTVAQMDTIVARYGTGQPIARIARDLGFTEQAVHRSLRRARLLREADRGPLDRGW
jgi:hypothetical protein